MTNLRFQLSCQHLITCYTLPPTQHHSFFGNLLLYSLVLVTSIPKIKGHRVCSVWLANIKSYRKWPWARDWHKSLWIENCIVFYWITLIKVSWEEAAVRSYLLVISMTVENIEGWKRCKRLFHYLLINKLSVKPRFYSPCPPFYW